MREFRFCVRVLVIVVGVLAPNLVLGQDSEVMRLNEKAMSAYQNMKIDAAMESLQKAEAVCLQNGLQGHETALTYLNMGVIEAAGRQNNAAAMDFFTKALCLEPSIAMDPLVSTPEVETVFNMSKNQAQSPDICAELATGVIPPPPPGDFPPPPGDDFPPPPGDDFPPPPGDDFPPPTMMPPGPSGPVPQSENVRHTAVTQQAKLTPVPLFVLVKPGTPVDKVVLNYRTFGERMFQQLAMHSHGEGYATTIGCDVMQNFNPTAIEYYISVIGPDGMPVGNSGTEMQPHQVTMVDTLVGPPPSLPNGVPPDKCAEECPPWNPDCNSGPCKQMGDLCDSSSDCCEGMICQEESCVPGEGGGPFNPFFRMSISVGTGGGVVFADSVTPYNQYANTPEAVWKNDPDNQNYCNFEGMDINTCYDEFYSREVSIGTGVSWSKLHFRINPMFYLTDKILLGATFRGGIPLTNDEGVMKIAPVGMVNFAYRMVGEGKDKFELDLMAGFGGGIIYHRIKYPDCFPTFIEEGHPWNGTDPETNKPYDKDGLGCYFVPDPNNRDNPDVSHPNNRMDRFSQWIAMTDTDPDNWKHAYFKRSGFLVAELGLDLNFWLRNKIGLNFGVMFDLYFPDLALNADVQFGPVMRF